MTSPTVIIITGLPGTGKTTLGQWLAERLGWPYIYKDGVKELLFDTLGWSDREWSKRLGAASVALIFYMAHVELAAGRSFIIESNFKPEMASGEFIELQARYGFKPVQIQCVADGEILWQRFKARAEAGTRHPGHVEQSQYPTFEASLRTGSGR